MLKKTKLYQELQKRESEYESKIDEVYEYASKILPKINRVFANYTGHGVEHSINVIQYMYELITDITVISDLEITCLIYAALLHDVGMAANEEEIESIKKDELNYHGRKYSVIYEKYQNENMALQECIRPVHGERTLHHIRKMEKEFFVVPGFTNCNFQEELAQICQAHTMNREWLRQNLNQTQVKGKDSLNAQYVAMLLRVADYLDIDEKRAPIELYRLLSPAGFGDAEWRQHYIIENREKVVKDHTSGNRTIVLYGQCYDSKIHRKFLQYLSGLSEELLWCTSYARKYFEEKYRLLIQPQIDNRIRTMGFEVSDLKLQVDYHAIVKLLMGENLYGNKKYGLRELIQNALDACRVMAEEAEHLEKYRYVPYVPQIQVILDYKAGKMIVMDNGIGMEYDVLTKYFLNIGKSYYKSDEFLYQGKSYCPIGTFGIGFLACFMLSDSVIVETKHYTDREGFTIELEKDNEFVCKKKHVHFIGESGTAIMLNLESALAVFEQKTENIKDYLENTFLDQGVRIRLITMDDTRNEETVDLKSFEELNPKGIRLDSYLNGISVYWNIDFDKIKVSKKFSDLCTDDMGREKERQFAEFDFDAKKLRMKDLSVDELRKYIENGQMMVLKVEGIKAEEEVLYEEWKERDDTDFSSEKMVRIIYFPIMYDESMLMYPRISEHYCDRCGADWYCFDGYHRQTIFERFDMKKNLRDFLKECGMLLEEVKIELGVFSIISVGNERCIEYSGNSWRRFFEKDATYWHGIRLDKGNMKDSIDIIGIHFGKRIVNILRNDIFPNIARDDLADDEKDMISSAIGRAAHQYIIDYLTEDRELQAALQDHIDARYPADNPYYNG